MRHAKAIISGIGTLAAALTVALGDDVLDMNDTVKLVTTGVEVVVTVWATWRYPTGYRVTKSGE